MTKHYMEPLVWHLVHEQVLVGKSHVRIDAFWVQSRGRQRRHDTCNEVMFAFLLN